MIGLKKRFVLKDDEESGHNSYKEHSGQIVTVFNVSEFGEGTDTGYHIAAEDGWTGLAWLNELEDI